MSKYESFAKETQKYFPRIRVGLQYFDHIFAGFHRKYKLQNFVSTLNSYYSTIQFTYKSENQNRLPVLDLTVIRRPDENVNIYRKPPQIIG